MRSVLDDLVVFIGLAGFISVGRRDRCKDEKRRRSHCYWPIEGFVGRHKTEGALGPQPNETTTGLVPRAMVVMLYVGHTLNTPAYRNVGVLRGALRLRLLVSYSTLNWSLLVPAPPSSQARELKLSVGPNGPADWDARSVPETRDILVGTSQR